MFEPRGASAPLAKLGPENAIAAIGGMRKRESGFDPVNGDREHF
jgi:hypothetical protein